jgi:hypothetical protein
MARVTVTYGHSEQFKVEFKLKDNVLMGRYLPGSWGKMATAWDERIVTVDNVAVIEALKTVLTTYERTED